MLRAVSAPTKELLELLVDNKLDLVLGSPTDRVIHNLEYLTIMEEDLYLVVSDSLLSNIFQILSGMQREVFQRCRYSPFSKRSILCRYQGI